MGDTPRYYMIANITCWKHYSLSPSLSFVLSSPPLLPFLSASYHLIVNTSWCAPSQGSLSTATLHTP